jgi:hypothetical protein
MSYKIRIDPSKGLSCPVIICDHCRGQIEHTRDGNALWLETRDNRRRDRCYDVVHTHKQCNHAYEASNPAERDQWWMSHELAHDIQMLLHNLGNDQPRSKRPRRHAA